MKKRRDKTKAAIYMRYSSHNQDGGCSIELQTTAILKYAHEQNLSIDPNDVYKDEAKSGTKEAGRDDFLRMIAEAPSKDFGTILIYKYSRFSRDVETSLRQEKELGKLGVSLIAVTEDFGSTASGKMLKVISATMAEVEVKTLAENVSRGLKERAKECKHTGGKPPLGFALDENKKLILGNADDVEAVKLIFSLRANSYQYSEIIKELEKKGLNRTATGRPFSKNSLTEILRNPKYKGTYIYNRAVSPFDGKRNNHEEKPVEEQIVIPGGCPQIVSSEIFDKVQEMRKRGQGGCNAKRIYLLSGKIQCGVCGKRFIVQYRNPVPGKRNKASASYLCSGKKNRPGHHCSNPSISMENLDKTVIGLVGDFLAQNDDKVYQAVNAHVLKKKQEAEEKISTLSKRLSSVVQKTENINTAIIQGIYNDTLKEQFDALSRQRFTLEKEIASLESEGKAEVISKESITKVLDEFRSRIYSVDQRLVKKALQEIVKKIVIDEKDIKVTLNVTFFHGSNQYNIGRNYEIDRCVFQPSCRQILKSA